MSTLATTSSGLSLGPEEIHRYSYRRGVSVTRGCQATENTCRTHPCLHYSGLQKRLQQETGARILIRGRGAVKPGTKPGPGDDEETHVLVTADTDEALEKVGCQGCSN
jgi:hypothetical protein